MTADEKSATPRLKPDTSQIPASDQATPSGDSPKPHGDPLADLIKQRPAVKST